MRLSKILATVAAIVCLCSGLAPIAAAQATPNCTSPSGSAETSLVICTDAGVLTNRAPLASSGESEQVLITSIDTTKMTLSSVDQIVAPAGWTISYFDGSTWSDTAPTTPNDWLLVSKVKATGPLYSGGADGGNQIASREQTIRLAQSSAFTGGDGGDGWSVFFDDFDHVYNLFHHDGTSQADPAADCHMRTGDPCGPGWPFALSPFHTNYQSEGWVDNTNRHLWFETNDSSGTGFACIDVSDLTTGPAWCGGSAASAFIQAGNHGGGSYGETGGLAVSGTRIFTWESATGNLLCVDTSLNGGAGGPCPNQPATFSGVTSAPFSGGQALIEYDGKLYGAAGTTAVCLDPVSFAVCSGWPISLTNPGYGVFPLPNSSGDIQGLCFVDALGVSSADPSITPCFDTSGQSISRPSSLVLKTSNAYDAYGKSPVVTGTRVYWAASWVTDGHYYCWDAAANSGAGGDCANWPIAMWPDYTIQIDPLNDNCLWTNADSGGIKSWDAVRGQEGCVTPPSTVTFDPDLVVPRMSCSSADPIVGWKNFSLSAPDASTYSSAALTVRTEAGDAVPGWSNVSISGSRVVDLTTLDVTASGQRPTFDVTFAWNDSGTPTAPTASVEAIGGQAELCLTPDVVATTCPARDSAAGTADVTAEGSTTVNSVTTNFDSAEAAIDLVDFTSAPCDSTLADTGPPDLRTWAIVAGIVIGIGFALTIIRRRRHG